MSKSRHAQGLLSEPAIRQTVNSGLVSFADVTEAKVEQNGPVGHGQFLYVDISSVDNRHKRIVDPKTIEVTAAPSRAKQRLKAGDVLVSMTRPNLNAVAMLPADFDGAIGSTGFHVLRASQGTEPRWLYYAVQTNRFVSTMSELVQGALYPAVRPKDIRAFEIPHPSLDEQKRIVAEIERQFSRLDEAVANLKRVKANLKRYKAAVLKAAVEGRLVETEAELARREGRSYETGIQLLQRILETRRSQWKGKGKYKEPAAPETTDLPELPEGWVWATLGQLVRSVKDGPHFSPKYSEQGIPFISGGNVRPEGIDFSSAKFISRELHDELSKRCKPELGDVLYTKGGTTGIARVNTEPREFNVWVHVAVLKLLDSIEPFYLQHALNSPHCYRQSQRHTHGVGNQDLGLTRMVWITVPLPSTIEQRRVVAEIDRQLSVIREAEVQVEVNLTRSERLRQAILATAFSGGLVPNDALGELSSELITQIRDETDATEVGKTPTVRTAETISKEIIVADMLQALKVAGDWISAQDVFRRCGMADGADTVTIERLYSELREYIRPGIIIVERRGEEDWLCLAKNEGV